MTVTVRRVLEALATYPNRADLLREYPELEPEDLRQVLEYAAASLGDKVERPVPTVSLMEFRDGKVAHETQYFADPFEAPAWRARWRETQPEKH